MSDELPLERWREHFCLSRGELARRADLAALTVWRIEKGKAVPVASTRRQIAAALHLSPRAIAWPQQRIS